MKGAPKTKRNFLKEFDFSAGSAKFKYNPNQSHFSYKLTEVTKPVRRDSSVALNGPKINANQISGKRLFDGSFGQYRSREVS